eukprot:3796303-Rhodomonas_salina.1
MPCELAVADMSSVPRQISSKLLPMILEGVEKLKARAQPRCGLCSCCRCLGVVVAAAAAAAVAATRSPAASTTTVTVNTAELHTLPSFSVSSSTTPKPNTPLHLNRWAGRTRTRWTSRR